MPPSYVFLVAVFLLTLNYASSARGPQFYYKMRDVGLSCKKGDVVRDDDNCATCVCMFQGVIQCFRSKCHNTPKRPKNLGGAAIALALATPSEGNNNTETIVKVQGCTPESEQTLEACVTCKCLTHEEMSCIKINPCTAKALASLDYLFY